MIIRKRAALLVPLWLIAGIALGLLPGSEDACGAPRRPRRLRLLPAPVEPWDLSGEPRPFEEVCFQDRSSLGGLGETEARKLLEPVAGQRLEIQPQARESAVRFVRFCGLAKLRSWAPDAAPPLLLPRTRVPGSLLDRPGVPHAVAQPGPRRDPVAGVSRALAARPEADFAPRRARHVADRHRRPSRQHAPGVCAQGPLAGRRDRVDPRRRAGADGPAR